MCVLAKQLSLTTTIKQLLPCPCAARLPKLRNITAAMNSENIDSKARKLEIKKQCAAAVEWLLQEPTETPTTAARIFKVEEHANSIWMALVRRRSRMRNNRGAFNGHGGNNKILAEY